PRLALYFDHREMPTVPVHRRIQVGDRQGHDVVTVGERSLEDGFFSHGGYRLIRARKEQLVAIKVIDLDRSVAPPRLLRRNRALAELADKISMCLGGQLDEQAPSVAAGCVFTEDDLALTVINLTDRSSAVPCVPAFLEAEEVHIEASRALHVGNEENGPRVPAVSRVASRCVFHRSLPVRLTQNSALAPRWQRCPTTARFLTFVSISAFVKRSAQ